MVAKGISQDDFPVNWVRRWANKSFRMRTMTVSESSPTNSPRRVVPYFYRHFSSIFSRTTCFVLKMIIFLIHGLGKCEGVSEDSRHGNEHIDIQVGSRIYLSVCLSCSIAYALRWGVTHLG